MECGKVTELIETHNHAEANEYLNNGYTLLAVLQYVGLGSMFGQDALVQNALYVLSKTSGESGGE